MLFRSYVVGQVLSGERGGEGDMAAADRLDEVTAYYLLHRHDFGVDDAPVGACILYATACGLSDADLDKTWDILVHAGGDSAEDEADSDESEDADGDAEPSEDSGSGGNKVKLKAWSQRRGKSMGYEAPQGKPVPLIDRIHRVSERASAPSRGGTGVVGAGSVLGVVGSRSSGA